MPSNNHFLDIPAELAHSDNPPYVFLPVPFEMTTCYRKGTRRGPRALMAASRKIEIMDEELMLPVNVPIRTLPALDFKGKQPASAMKHIYLQAAAQHSAGRFILAAGGEHSLSAPLVKAAAEKYRNLSVIQFDAHLDLRHSYFGTTYSHGSVMRRIHDLNIPTVHVGIRSICSEEKILIDSENIPVFFAREMIGRQVSLLASRICSRLTKNVYISFDVDALDPSIMPGTGTPEPGGLDWLMATGLLREIIRRKNVVSADIVELCPITGSNVSEYVAARLAQKLVTYHWHRNKL